MVTLSPASGQRAGLAQKLIELVGRNAERHVDRVDPGGRERRVVDHGAEAVGHRVGDDAVDPGGRAEGVEAVQVAHLPPADLPGREGAFVVEGREHERRAHPAAEDAGRHADVTHADADGGHLGRRHQFEHPQVVGGVVGHGRDLDDVGVEGGQAGVQGGEVGGRAEHVVVAHHPPGLPVAADAAGDVVLEVDVVGPLDDREPQELQAGLLRLLPPAAVLLPAAGHDRRTGAILEEPLDLHFALDVVEPQLDERDAVVGQVLVFGDHVPVAAATDAHADHREVPESSKVREFRCDGTGGRGPAGRGSATWAGRADSGGPRARVADRGRANRPPPGRAGRPP